MAQIKLRRDTYQNWYTYNPILADGEPSYDSTNNKIKVGNGITNWRTLPYLTDIGSVFPSNSVGFLSNDGLGNLSWVTDNDTAYLTTETDPVFTAWNKSTGISITESQISDLQDYLTTETDPVFTAWNKSTGISITESQISDLQDYLTTETDPVFTAWNKSTGISITESQISDLQDYLTTETDPVFTAWNKSTGISITESQISDLQDYVTDYIPSNTFYVDPTVVVTNPTGSIIKPFNSISDAIDAAILKNNSYSSPIFIWLLSDVTEDIILTRGGIYLIGTGIGRAVSANIYGTITINGSSTTTILENTFSITNLTITAPLDSDGIYFTGLNPQTVFFQEVLINSTGIGNCITSDNSNPLSVMRLYSSSLDHDGTSHCIKANDGTIYVKNTHIITNSEYAIEISGTHIYNKIIDSVINGTIMINNGALEVSNCSIINPRSITSVSHGFSLTSPNSKLIIYNSLIGVSTSGSADSRAIHGVAGVTVMFNNLSFFNPISPTIITGYNNLVSTAIGAGLQQLPSTLVSA